MEQIKQHDFEVRQIGDENVEILIDGVKQSYITGYTIEHSAGRNPMLYIERCQLANMLHISEKDAQIEWTDEGLKSLVSIMNKETFNKFITMYVDLYEEKSDE